MSMAESRDQMSPFRMWKEVCQEIQRVKAVGLRIITSQQLHKLERVT